MSVEDVTRYARPQPFEELDHTADAGVRVRGRTAEETLARLVLAFTELVTGGARVKSEETRVVEVEPGDWGLQAVDVLRELLFELETKRRVPEACRVERFDQETGARLRVELGHFDASESGEGLVLKAVTWHAARFERDDEDRDAPWCAQIVFDV